MEAHIMESQFLHKKQAKGNDNIELGETVTVHSSSQSEITVTPFFIKHSDPEKERDLYIKITKNKRMSGITQAECEINIKEAGIMLLRDKINEYLALKKIPENGNFLLVRLGNEQQVDLSGLDTSDVAKALISVLENDDIIEHIDAVDFSDNLAFAFRNSIRIKSLIKAMDELEVALETESSEQFYQEWCERNGWIFGNQYVMKDDERRISRNDNVDFLATSVISGFRDIIELKKPTFTVLNFDQSHDSYYFAAEVSKAIGQCHRYLDVFAEEASTGLRDNREIVAYHPRATIVVGRSNDWNEEQHRALHGLNSRMSGMTVLTYDHLLQQGRRLINMLQNECQDVAESPMDDFDEDGELPF